MKKRPKTRRNIRKKKKKGKTFFLVKKLILTINGKRNHTTYSKMSMNQIVWRPAREVLDEEDALTFQPPTCLYGSALYPIYKEGEVQPPTPLIDVKDLPVSQWRKEQEYRRNAPIGTRILLQRRIHELAKGDVIQDIMMVRVDKPHKWNTYHVFYFEHEPSPLPLHTKKRKFT